MAKNVKENEKVDIEERLKELPVEFRLRAIDRLNIRELKKKKTMFSKFLLLLALIGPGIIVMIADNDAGGVITYAQTGSIFGIGFFIPFMLLMIPVAYIVQEMTIRLAAVTGRGHAELIWKRYGKFWGAFSLGDLVIANSLTLITEFIGITFGMGLFGINPMEAVLIGIAFISIVTFGLRYHKWERISLIIAAFNVIFIPLMFFAHPNWSAVANTLSTWKVAGGFTPLFLYVLLASIGTTIAPWMLFFQQSSEVDKGIIPEDINSGRRDTLIGAVVMAVVAIAIIILTGTVVYGTVSNGSTTSYNIQFIISTMENKIGSLPVDLFAIGLVDAGLIAAIAITASTSWAVGEAFNWPKSINLPFLKGRKFYIPGLVSMAFAAIIVLIPNIPLGFLNLTVQVIASVFMPAALLFLLLLANDKKIMGKHTNKPWQNIASISIMIFLVAASSLYGLSLVFPNFI